MPTSATGRTSSRRAAGFTLVELMVVVAVVGLAAGAVAWALPDPQGRVSDEAARFALHVRAARDAAITQARPVGVWVGEGGYGFDAREGGAWRALPRPLDTHAWAAGTGASLSASAPRVRVVFDPTGLADRPLEVRLRRRGAGASVRIDVDGGVTVGG